MKFSIKDFFSKCHQIHSFLRISSHLLKKSLMENFIFCAVLCTRYFDSLQRCIEDFLSMKLDCWWLVHRLLLSEVLLCLVFFAVQKVYPRVVFFRKIWSWMASFSISRMNLKSHHTTGKKCKTQIIGPGRVDIDVPWEMMKFGDVIDMVMWPGVL